MKVERWSGSASPTEASLRARLEADGYSVYAWTDGPGATYPPHAHGDDQSHCVVRGRLAQMAIEVLFVTGVMIFSGHIIAFIGEFRFLSSVS